MTSIVLKSVCVGLLTATMAIIGAAPAAACPGDGKTPTLQGDGGSPVCPGDKKPSLRRPDDKKPKSAAH